MGLREEIAKRIERKRAEIAELETQVRLGKEYCQALEDTLKMLPKEAKTGASPAATLRQGSSLARSYEAIRKTGRPMHLTELLSALGKGTSRNERAGLSGTLATYVRRGEIFTRPAPNTFGLVEFESSNDSTVEQGPPPGFGKL